MIEFVATPADGARAHDLLGRYFAEREETFPSAQGAYTVNFPDAARFVPPLGEFYVVTDDHEPIGCGGIRRIPDSDDDHPVTRFEIKHVWIAPASRGAGAARRLMQRLEARAVELGAAQVVLDTNESLTAAAGLYRSAGYRQVAPYNDNPNATHWYAKDL